MREDLPAMKPKEVIAALEKAGFELKRQTGSHLGMRNLNSFLISKHEEKVMVWKQKTVL